MLAWMKKPVQKPADEKSKAAAWGENTVSAGD
jgi:hypothetical protein